VNCASSKAFANMCWRNTHFAAESGRSRVSVVEPADAGQRDDLAQFGALGRSPGRRVPVERHVGPVVV
jgi:hypothetical protein